MSAVKMSGIALIVVGILGLAYGGFSYTRETYEAKLGPLELTVKDTQRVNRCGQVWEQSSRVARSC